MIKCQLKVYVYVYVLHSSKTTCIDEDKAQKYKKMSNITEWFTVTRTSHTLHSRNDAIRSWYHIIQYNSGCQDPFPDQFVNIQTNSRFTCRDFEFDRLVYQENNK